MNVTPIKQPALDPEFAALLVSNLYAMADGFRPAGADDDCTPCKQQPDGWCEECADAGQAMDTLNDAAASIRMATSNGDAFARYLGSLADIASVDPHTRRAVRTVAVAAMPVNLPQTLPAVTAPVPAGSPERSAA